MTDRRDSDLKREPNSHEPEDLVESALTTPEDVASAGRSCMAIVILFAVILAVIAIWIVYAAVGGE